jgi:hypothetical protein
MIQGTSGFKGGAMEVLPVKRAGFNLRSGFNFRSKQAFATFFESNFENNLDGQKL